MLIGAIVLAGGSSERMQEPKAALRWGDASLLYDRTRAMLECAYPVVVVRRDEEQPLPPLDTECEVTVDAVPGGNGPLPAILAGLRSVADRCDAAIVMGVDFPFFERAHAHWLAERLGDHDGAVPMDGEEPQPVCAIYRTKLLADVEKLVADGKRAARAMLDLPRVVTIDTKTVEAFDAERRFLFNVNTPEDYAQAEKWRS